MPVNEILPFALASDANVATQAEYAASVTTTKGHLQGVAPSKGFNKAWRQALFMCSALAQVVVDATGLDVRDDGDVPGLVAKIKTAIQALAGAPVGTLMFAIGTTAPVGTLKANGTAILRTDYLALANYLYVGDANNNTAPYGYRCTDPLNATNTRSTAGTYIVLPDYRDMHIRGWSDGKGGKTRKIYDVEADMIRAHNHTASTDTQGWHAHTGVTTTNGAHSHDSGWGESINGPYGNARSGVMGSGDTNYDNFSYWTSTNGDHNHGMNIDGNGSHAHNVTVNNTGGIETRPANYAALICIKY